jgi:NitT/TauT family transport system ATP-binding protein
MPDAPAQGQVSSAVGGTAASTQTAAVKVVREPPIETLPNVPVTSVVGLLEMISDQGGISDIFELAQRSGKDFGSTLYLVKAAELFDLVETPKHAVILTDLGRRFVDADINARKRILHELFGSLKIVQLTTNLLKTDESLRIPVEKLSDRVTEWLPNENPAQIVEALVSWGRFAEYFGYNDDTKEVYLDIGQESA